MRLYKDKYIDFRFDVDADILTVKFLSNQPIFQETAQFTSAIELVNAKRLLLDLSVVESFHSEAVNLLWEDLTEQLLKQGIRKMAIIKSPNPEINTLIEAIIMEHKPKRMKLKFFDDITDAIIWLKNNYSKD